MFLCVFILCCGRPSITKVYPIDCPLSKIYNHSFYVFYWVHTTYSMGGRTIEKEDGNDYYYCKTKGLLFVVKRAPKLGL